ncbi:MAG: Quinohemoprotein amine dehydrogenase A, alpha subunit, heme binding [Rhodobacteraceae bacterium HLUCCA12]|nr:MAG: Quinohemoprotein amine dehydrogenase A, alpha subunit, heme binding [Rhodobacteraceae bacterium HLUCCA12]
MIAMRFKRAALVALVLTLAVPALADEAENEWDPLPPGDGAEETYYACNACHSLRTVTNGGYSREVWDDLLDWMVEEQGMEELEPDERETILDYLSENIGPD